MGRRFRWIASRPKSRQRRFAFLDRTDRLDRRFRRVILGFTLIVILLLLGATSTGRYGVRRAWTESQRAILSASGLPPDRAEIDADWAMRRARGVAQTEAAYRTIYDQAPPRMKGLLDYSSLDPERAVLRWGNYNKILLLPGSVFAPDDAGRSYRMRPNVRSIWLKGVSMAGGLDGFFLVPDGPEVPKIIEGTGAFIVPNSSQTTNSWGCRGPEPDLQAPLRGLILGDSNMQGLFVADHETPPEHIRVELETRLKTRVSLLNTGHLGYSPEQFHACLVEYGDRFRPHFVLVTLCVNDFGDAGDVLGGTWELPEAKYWIDRIHDYCRAREILCVMAPVPYDHQITGRRRDGNYPGKFSDVCPVGSLNYCCPIDDLADEFLRLRLRVERDGETLTANPLYNEHIQDHHFSALGTEVFGRAVGRRLALLLELRKVRGLTKF